MPKFTFVFEGIDNLRADLKKLRGLLVDDLDRAAAEAAIEGAIVARSGHDSGGEDFPNRGGPYQDRTGAATRSIRSRIVSVGLSEIKMDAKHAHFLMGGTKPHVIPASQGSWLHWERPQGDKHYAKSVMHPGTTPDVTWDRTEDKARVTLAVAVDKALDAFDRRWATATP